MPHQNDSDIPPGSSEAVEKGCTCPVAKNNNGQGVPLGAVQIPSFYIDPQCPLHHDWKERVEKIVGREIHLEDS